MNLRVKERGYFSKSFFLSNSLEKRLGILLRALLKLGIELDFSHELALFVEGLGEIHKMTYPYSAIKVELLQKVHRSVFFYLKF